MHSQNIGTEQIEELVGEYEYAEIVSDTEEHNQAYRKADGEDMPVVWVEVRRKYGDVKSDFITTEPMVRGLNDEAYELICELNDRFMGRTLRRAKESHRSDVIATNGTYTPGMQGLLIDDMVEYLDEFLQIFYDHERWEIRKV